MLAAEQTLFFSAEEDEAQIVLAGMRGQDARQFEHACAATAVIVGAGGRGCGATGEVDRIQMSRDEHYFALSGGLASFVGDDISAGFTIDSDVLETSDVIQCFQLIACPSASGLEIVAGRVASLE